MILTEQRFNSPEVMLYTTDGVIDLHESDFSGFSFNALESCLTLNWIRLQGILHFSIKFIGVKKLLITPMDNTVPRSEDCAMDHFVMHDIKNNLHRIDFLFYGGMKLEVEAINFELKATARKQS